MASFSAARSVVEFSLSPFYHYQYSSISKSLSSLCEEESHRKDLEDRVRRFCMSYAAPQEDSSYYLLSTDSTPLPKPYSESLQGRTYISVPNNRIKGNKPLSIGYEASLINLCDPQTSWNLPLSIKRVSVNQTASECALWQLEELLEDCELELSEGLVVNTLDSRYSNASYLSPAHKYDQLVNILRLRSGIKVYSQACQKGSLGAPKIYGDCYYLHETSCYKTYKHPKSKEEIQKYQRSIFELPSVEHQQFSAETKRGRKFIVKIWKWKDMLLRSKDGHNMKDKPFDVLCIQVFDAQTQKRVFKRGMFLAICGKAKDKIPIYQGYDNYRHRYDIEPYLRFAKQSLLLDKYQTPQREHLDNYFLVIQLASWLLYAASDEVGLQVRKWESYLPGNKSVDKQKRLSISQTRKSVSELFSTFDLIPFMAQKSKKGKGRQKGQTFPPRVRHKVVKKNTQKRKSKHKTEQIE